MPDFSLPQNHKMLLYHAFVRELTLNSNRTNIKILYRGREVEGSIEGVETTLKVYKNYVELELS